MSIARLYNFSPGTPIVSAQVDAEFDQLVAALNGNSDDVDVTMKLDHAVNPPLTLNQTGSGPIFYAQNSGDVVTKINNDGSVSVAGTSTAADYYKLGGQYKQNVTEVGNVGSGEDDLHSYTLLANTWSANGDCLHIRAMFQVTAAGNNKVIKFYIDGAVVGAEIFSSGNIDPASTNQYILDVEVIRLDADELLTTGTFTEVNTDTTTVISVGTSGHTFSNAIIVKFTGEDADGTNDRVIQQFSFIRKYPAA